MLGRAFPWYAIRPGRQRGRRGRRVTWDEISMRILSGAEAAPTPRTDGAKDIDRLRRWSLPLGRVPRDAESCSSGRSAPRPATRVLRLAGSAARSPPWGGFFKIFDDQICACLANPNAFTSRPTVVSSNPLREVLQTPAHDAMDRGDWTASSVQGPGAVVELGRQDALRSISPFARRHWRTQSRIT